MTKVTVSRIFEVGQIASTKAYGELQSFIEYTNLFTDNVIRILRNGISVTDNLDATVFSVPLNSANSQKISVKQEPIAVLVIRQSPITNPLTKFVWDMTSDKSLSLTATFTTTPTPTNPVTLKLLIIYS